MALTPALAAAYGTMSLVGRTAPVLETLMIEPPPAATIRSPTSAARRNGPLRLTAITLSNSSSLTSVSLSYMRRDAGVVDEDVDAPEVAVDVLDEGVELVPVPDVAGARGSLGALGAQRRRDLVAGVGLAADDDDLGARLGERPGHGEPEPARAAGDDRDAAGEVEAVARRPRPGLRCVSAGSCRTATS